MNTADKLMNIAIDGDRGEEVVVKHEGADEEVVEETTVTKTVRKKPPEGDRVIIVED